MRNGKIIAAMGLMLMAGAAGCQQDKPSTAQSAQLMDGYAALTRGNSDTAIAKADEYLRKEPHGAGSAEALYLKGRGYESKTAANASESRRNLVEAKTAYGDALNEHPSVELESKIRASLSNVAFFMEDFPAAFAESSQAYKLTDSPETQSVLLYRMGVCQQRMGRFTDADTTFQAVQTRYPGSDMAKRAKAHQNVRDFFLQLATYNTPANADKAIEGLKNSGMALTKRSGDAGRIVVLAGPFPSYDSAKDVRGRMAADFPDAIIVP